MTRALLVICLATVGLTAPQSLPLPRGAERAYDALKTRFDRTGASQIVGHMDQYWRVAGNPGFNASLDYIHGRLAAAGFGHDKGEQPWVRVDEYANTSRGWDYRVGTLALEGDAEPVLSRDRDRVSLAINSFPTPPDGLRARLVDVGDGASEADYADRDVRGAVVLGNAPLGRLWQQAVRARGAAGVVSTDIAGYIRPGDPSEMTEEQKDVFQWGSIPYDASLKSFGFKASWRAAARLREALARARDAHVRVTIDASFYEGPVRTLAAEIPGRTRPLERIVLVAHVQEPGANDNASGCATLYGVARALAQAIRAGALPRPDRTLTFLWVDEIRGSRQWIQTRKDEASGVRYMFSLDMTGEDTSKTGGTFLIEKQADPSAAWARPSDPGTEWGGGRVDPKTLKGSLLNDLHIAVAERRAKETGWVVRTNPYEGGSDHTVFAAAGVPSLLNWHFTDRYYHTNQDRPDKTSAETMEHVGVTVGTSAWFLASAAPADAMQVVDLLEAAAARRLALERAQGPEIVARATDRAAAERVERQVIEAWQRWYREALESVLTLPPDGANEALRDRVAAAAARIR